MEGGEGSGWAMPPAPAYLDGAFSPRKLGKGQVEQEPGWGRCGADPGKPRTSPCARQCLPGGRRCYPGHPHPNATRVLPPPRHPRAASVPAGETDCCLRPGAAPAPHPQPGGRETRPMGLQHLVRGFPSDMALGFSPHSPPKSQMPNISEHQLPARKQAGLRQPSLPPLPPAAHTGKAVLPDLWCSKWCLT